MNEESQTQPLIPETPSPSAQTLEEVLDLAMKELAQGHPTLKFRYEFTRSVIGNAITKAKAVREEKEQTQQTSGLTEPSADNVEVVLQKARELAKDWSNRRDNIDTATIGSFEYRAGLKDATEDCQTDLEKLLSSHSNVIGAPPISPSPSSLPPQSQGSEQGWISIADQLPSGKDEVLYWDGEEVGTFIPDTHPIHQPKLRCNQFGVTHWMPLPQAPSVGRGPDEHLAAPGKPSPALSKEVPVGAPKEWRVEDGPREWLEPGQREKVRRGYVCEDGKRITRLIDIDDAHDLRRAHNATLERSAPSPLQTQGRWTVAQEVLLLDGKPVYKFHDQGSAQYVLDQINASLKDDKKEDLGNETPLAGEQSTVKTQKGNATVPVPI